jgi:hypothetical protein
LSNLIGQAIQQGPQLLQRTFVFFGEFKEHRGVRNLSFEFFLPRDGPFQPAALL